MAVKIDPSDKNEQNGEIVAKAVFNAAVRLGLTQAELSEIIGISPAQVTKLKKREAILSGKQMEAALYLIRVFRSLDAITGGDAEVTKEWLRNKNLDLHDIPAEALKKTAGLVDTMNYLDAARAPI